MESEPPFQLVDTERAHEQANQLFLRIREAVLEIAPASADVRHIGATAVPGCLTKGDLDIVIRVPTADFSVTDAALASRFARNEGSLRNEAFSAFEDTTSHPHLGLQLTAIDGPLDVFHLFVEALQRSPGLVEEYNTLKREHDGGSVAAYRAAKDAFVERVLRDQRLRQ